MIVSKRVLLLICCSMIRTVKSNGGIEDQANIFDANHGSDTAAITLISFRVRLVGSSDHIPSRKDQ